MHILKRKRSSRKLTVEPQARTERRKGIKVKLYLLIIKGRVTTGQDSTQLGFQLVEGKGLWCFLLLGKNKKEKVLQM